MDNVTFWSEHGNQLGDVTQAAANTHTSPTTSHQPTWTVIWYEWLVMKFYGFDSLLGWTQEVQVWKVGAWFQFIEWGIIPWEFLSDNEQINEALLDDEITKERSILGNVIWTRMLL